MNWREVLAWQQIGEQLATRASVGQLPLIGSDSSRIYLRITLNSLVGSPNFYYLTTVPPKDQNGGGIQIGQRWQASTGNQFREQSVAGTIGNVSAPAIPYSFTAAPGTGSFWNNATLIAISWAPDPANPGTYDTPDIAPQLAPMSIEFWLDRHGALCQSPWYVWDHTGGAVFHILTVRQERNPCDYQPGTTIPRSRKGKVITSGQLPLKAFRRARNLAAHGGSGNVVGEYQRLQFPQKGTDLSAD